MDDDSLQQLLRDQLPDLAAPTSPPPNARSRVREAVTRRRRRVRATVGTSVASALALVVLVPLAVMNGPGSDDSGPPVDDPIGHWESIASAPLSARDGSASVWTGEEMIVVGGNVRPPCPPSADCDGPSPDQLRADGAAYDPETDTWRSIAAAPVPFTYAQAVWTGREMVVLEISAVPNGKPGHTLAYDPEADAWRELDPPPDAYLIGGVWDGRELFYWQSEQRAGDGDWSLDPSTGEWTRLPDDPFEPTYDRAYVWTGDRFVFLGIDKSRTYASGDGGEVFQVAEYDPATRTWRRLPDSPVGGGDPMWFFHQGYVVNPFEDPRFDSDRPTNGAYDPNAGTWSEAPGSGRYTYAGCMLGPLGSGGDWLAPGGGVLYSLDPADTVVTPDCPQLPEPAAAAWAGERVIIWGGPNRAYDANTNLGLAWTPPPAA
jgi:hypothetical protein